MQRAQGKPGARRTRSLACELKKAHEYSHHRFAGFNRPSLRNGFNGFLRTLPGDRAFCHRRLQDHHLTSLTSASGCQDHTTSPSASSAVRLAASKRPPHPAPNVRDDREAPLLSRRDGVEV